MEVAIISDTHVTPSRGQHLRDFVDGMEDIRDYHTILAVGDIVNGPVGGSQQLRELYPKNEIIYVPGNHEFYGTSIERGIEIMIQEASAYDVNLLIDGSKTVEHKGIVFCGGTMWTDFEVNGSHNLLQDCHMARHFISDYQMIDGFNAGKSIDMCNRFYNNLKTVIDDEYPDNVKVILTHHLPFRSCIHDKFMVSPTSQMLNAAFANDWEDRFIRETPHDIELWVHGHTHDHHDFFSPRAHIRTICNPRGYAHERTNNFYHPYYVEL